MFLCGPLSTMHVVEGEKVGPKYRNWDLTDSKVGLYRIGDFNYSAEYE